jgi:hypothetical protein
MTGRAAPQVGARVCSQLRQLIAAEAPARCKVLHAAAPNVAARETTLGTLSYALSPLQIHGVSRDWARPVGRQCRDLPEWR